MRQLLRLKLGSTIPVTIAIMLMTVLAAAQSGPSASSGINPNDTYCIFDLTLQNQGTLTLSQPVLDPATNTSTSTIPMNPGPTHLHVEAGYDVNDRLVLNVVFTDPPVDPTTTSMDPVGRLRITNGRMVLYDWSGNPMPLTLPANMPMPKTPQAFFGLAAGPSVLNGMVLQIRGALHRP